jgi:hypothetical protein
MLGEGPSKIVKVPSFCCRFEVVLSQLIRRIASIDRKAVHTNAGSCIDVGFDEKA